MIVFGIAGFKRSGKDTAANYLVDNYGFTKLNFADELKQHVYLLNPVVYKEYRLQELINEYGWDYAKVHFPEIRRLLQVYGTEIVRDNFGENTWIDLLFRKAAKLNIEKLVIADVRFPNELESVLERGGTLIKIKSAANKSHDTHASEQDLPNEKFNVIIENNGSLSDFYTKLDIIMVARYANS